MEQKNREFEVAIGYRLLSSTVQLGLNATHNTILLFRIGHRYYGHQHVYRRIHFVKGLKSV